MGGDPASGPFDARATEFRIGAGEYDTPDGIHILRRSRGLFLHLAATLEPELLPSLGKAIGSLPVETFEVPVYADDGAGDELLLEVLSRFDRFRAAIESWRKGWHLTDDWINNELHDALCWVRGNQQGTERVREAWRYFDLERARSFSPIYPPTGGLPGTTAFSHSLAKPLPDLFVFKARWYPQFEFRADITRWLKKRFQEDLAAYLDAVEKQMESAGLVKTPTKRPRWGADAKRHFNWLVRYQVQSWTHERIAAEHQDLHTSTVAIAVKSTAELIGLTRRSLSTPK